ncbi:MAG TPA: nucleoside-diphosphate kinase [Thermoanaerobaculia bacterium]|jgi:nucleoside-diphosphate kinase
MIERTLAILKPDSVTAGKSGTILARLEDEGFVVRGLKRLRLTGDQARAFYEIHRERPFFEGLVRFMTEGPVVVAALEREDAVAHLRKTMGATDSKRAEQGTLRNLYGTDIERNAIHGSDSAENAAREVGFFFSEAELVGSGLHESR